MKGLLLRLSALDAAAENAVRVIGFFDQLIARRVDRTTLAREAARLAECPVGVGVGDRAGAVCAAPDGRTWHGSGPGPTAVVREHPDGSRVWLERTPPALPLDEILLERLAIVAAALSAARTPPPEPDDAALVEVALSASIPEAERCGALRRLGFRPDEPLLVLAVAPGPVGAAQVAGLLGGRTAPIGSLHAVLAHGPAAPETAPLPAQARIGAAPAVPAVAAPAAWRRARTAARLAGPLRGPFVRWADLGAIAVLADRIPSRELVGLADLDALDRLSSEPAGAGTLALLAAYCETGSVRQAAAAVHRHHSTATARLHYAEEQLGFTVTSPPGRFRLELALLLHHLRDTPG